jgi:hypothetical protein
MADLPAAKVSAETMLAAMSTAPVLNGGTRFTTVMSASTNEYKTWIQEKDGDDSTTDAEAMRKRAALIENLRYFLRQLTGLPLGPNTKR